MSEQIHLKAIMVRNWRIMRNMLKSHEQTQALVSCLPSRSEIERAMLSRSYAITHYPDLESMRAFDWLLETMSTMQARAGRPAAILNQIRTSRTTR